MTTPADQTIKKLGEDIAKYLSAQNIWDSPLKQRAVIGEKLRVVGIYRLVAAIPVIVPHITWQDGTDDGKIRSNGEVFPVYSALQKIGLPAIPYILSELKKTEPKDNKGEISQKHKFLIRCIRDIYGQGGHGVVLAKKRLELELAATKDKKEKANLQAALAHPIFKEEKLTATQKAK